MNNEIMKIKCMRDKITAIKIEELNIQINLWVKNKLIKLKNYHL